jgi:hypothetical protein
MPVTFVRDPATGIGYSVNIAGDAPTEQETARINEFLGCAVFPLASHTAPS